MKLKLSALVLLFLTGCLMKPTNLLEESVDALAPNTVLVDTRSPLQYESFHIEGSVNIRAEDFIIVRNPTAKKKFQKRGMEQDLDLIISRLAEKGINRDNRVILLADKADANSNKRMKWLLKNLEVSEVQTENIDAFMQKNPGKFARPTTKEVWNLRSSRLFQKEFIIDKSERCFSDVKKWSEGFCNP